MHASRAPHCHRGASARNLLPTEREGMPSDEPAHARPQSWCPQTAARSPRQTVFSLIPGRLSFAAHASVAVTYQEIDCFPKRFYFSSNFHHRYSPFCLDFGPVNLATVHEFCAHVRRFWGHDGLQEREMCYYTADTLESRTNTAFLLAAFMVNDLGYSPEDAWAPFAKMPESLFATYRDASYCEQKYGLTVLACLKGLHKALTLGWYCPRGFSVDDYNLLEKSEAGDMHVVSPKFIASKGPVDLCAQPIDDIVDDYALPPAHYVEAFKELGVSAVVRLNEASTYDSKCFTEEGIDHHDIYFDDCTMPGRDAVRAFLEAVEAEEGVVAVHCRAGLGRTGTLIAVYFMEHHGFTAAEAIGWLRIVRPGSVIGDQQHFLHWYEATQGGSVNSPLSEAELFQLMKPEELHSASPTRAADLGRAVKQAQVERARRHDASPTPPRPTHTPHRPSAPPRRLSPAPLAAADVPPPLGAGWEPALAALPPLGKRRGSVRRLSVLAAQGTSLLSLIRHTVRGSTPALTRS